MPRIEFFGMVFSADGMSPDPAKVGAIKQAEAPTLVGDVCSLLGSTNYVSRFTHEYADIMAPLCDLTHKGIEFKWEDVRQAVLERLKRILTSQPERMFMPFMFQSTPLARHFLLSNLHN